MKNIWFHGGGYACMWSFGVAQAFKESNITFNNIGGYSAGSLVATFMSNPNANVKDVLTSCYDSPYGPNKGRFTLLGKHQRNLAYMGENVVGNPLDWNNGANFNNKLWIPIRGLKSLKGSWRYKYRSYDDLISCLVSTNCIPGVSGEFSNCYYDNDGDRYGPTIDGGLFSYNPPKSWISETIIVSPWGKGGLNMNPPAKLVDIAIPKYNTLKSYYENGFKEGLNYVNTYKL
jgi:hypothetical protein